jgi:hypothetical protein
MAGEHKIQNQGRNALTEHCLCFRANVGQGWTGNREDVMRISRPGPIQVMPGDVVIRNARPFSTGLPVGFHDTFGIVPVTITQDMVGQTIGAFFSVEFKDIDGQLTREQSLFCSAIKRNGGRSGVARSAQDAVDIVLGRKA